MGVVPIHVCVSNSRSFTPRDRGFVSFFFMFSRAVSFTDFRFALSACNGIHGSWPNKKNGGLMHDVSWPFVWFCGTARRYFAHFCVYFCVSACVFWILHPTHP